MNPSAEHFLSSLARLVRATRSVDPPSPLLVVASASAPVAAQSWRDWRAQGGDIETLGPVEHSVLPSLARRLVALEIADPDLPRLVGINRYCWSQNQQVLFQLRQEISVLLQAGLPVMVDPAVALFVADGRDIGAEHLGSIGCTVPAHRAPEALALLAARGRLPSVAGTPHDIALTRRSVQLRRAETTDGGFCLAWSPQLAGGGDLWERARVTTLGSQPVLAPGREDLLVEVLARGATGRSDEVNWILQSTFIFEQFGADLDGPLLAEIAARRHDTLSVSAAIHQLVDRIGTPVPPRLRRAMNTDTVRLADHFLPLALRRPAAHVDEPLSVVEDWWRLRSSLATSEPAIGPVAFVTARMGARDRAEVVQRLVVSLHRSRRHRAGPGAHPARRSLYPPSAFERLRALRVLCGALMGRPQVGGDWTAAAALARECQLEAALWGRLEAAGQSDLLPEPAATALRDAYRRNVAATLWRTRQLRAVLVALREVGIEPLLLKGARALLESPKDEVLERYMWDLDLIVESAQFEQALQALGRLGYQAYPGEGGSARYEWTLVNEAQPAHLDLHFETGTDKVREVLPTEAVFARAERRQAGTDPYLVLSPVDELVHAVLHTEIADRGQADHQLDPRQLYNLCRLWLRLESTDTWQRASGYLAAQGHAHQPAVVAELLREFFEVPVEAPSSTPATRREVRTRLVVFALPNLLDDLWRLRCAFEGSYMAQRYPELSVSEARLHHALHLVDEGFFARRP